MKKKKFAFVQEWGTYASDTLVCVGMDRGEIVKHMLRKKMKKDLVKMFAEKTKDFDAHIGDNSDELPRVFYYQGITVMSFANWKNDWQHLDSLNHEVSHLVHAILGHHRNMMDEDEARAYQHEFLFKEIRRKLYDKSKC